MSAKHLREQLNKLQKEIESLPVDHDQRDKLHALVGDIGSELEADSVTAIEENGLQERLDEMVSNFETEHPTTAAILKDIMVKLASIGV